jgi:hypothetical protein
VIKTNRKLTTKQTGSKPESKQKITGIKLVGGDYLWGLAGKYDFRFAEHAVIQGIDCEKETFNEIVIASEKYMRAQRLAGRATRKVPRGVRMYPHTFVFNYLRSRRGAEIVTLTLKVQVGASVGELVRLSGELNKFVKAVLLPRRPRTGKADVLDVSMRQRKRRARARAADLDGLNLTIETESPRVN